MCYRVRQAYYLGANLREAIEPAKLVAPMLARFMASDRAFVRARRESNTTS
ncbi:MAG: DUF2274 domain-containing protein [Rhodoplanes sp.]